MDMRGSCVEETGRLWETGDPDLEFRVLADTLHPSASTDTTHAQAVMVPVEDDGGLDPRRILQRQIAALAKSGFEAGGRGRTGVLCLQSVADGQFRLQTPNGLVADPDWQQLYQFEELDCGSPFIDDIYRIAEGQGFPSTPSCRRPAPANSRST